MLSRHSCLVGWCCGGPCTSTFTILSWILEVPGCYQLEDWMTLRLLRSYSLCVKIDRPRIFHQIPIKKYLIFDSFASWQSIIDMPHEPKLWTHWNSKLGSEWMDWIEARVMLYAIHSYFIRRTGVYDITLFKNIKRNLWIVGPPHPLR